MAYDTTKLTKLAALKALAEKTKAETDALDTRVTNLSTRVDDIVSTGGEPNAINTIQVNGTEQTITDKTVNISVPTKTSQLTNDSSYQTNTEVATAIQTAISKTGHASFKKVDSIPTAATAEENILYLVMNAETAHYDIYALVSGAVVLLDDTTVDLSAYSTTEAINALLDKKVDKVDGKGLSTNDYTTAEKEKLASIEIATDAEVTEMLTEVFGA